MDNAFLRNFLKAREAMTAEASKPKAKGSSDKVIKLEEPEKGVSLMTIIEDCPPKAKVLEYLRRRIEEIEAEED